MRNSRTTSLAQYLRNASNLTDGEYVVELEDGNAGKSFATYTVRARFSRFRRDETAIQSGKAPANAAIISVSQACAVEDLPSSDLLGSAIAWILHQDETRFDPSTGRQIAEYQVQSLVDVFEQQSAERVF